MTNAAPRVEQRELERAVCGAKQGEHVCTLLAHGPELKHRSAKGREWR